MPWPHWLQGFPSWSASGYTTASTESLRATVAADDDGAGAGSGQMLLPRASASSPSSAFPDFLALPSLLPFAFSPGAAEEADDAPCDVTGRSSEQEPRSRHT